jgi:hypothetical protein
VKVINLANIEMADFACRTGFRRQTLLMAPLGALDRNPPIQDLVRGFVNHRHSANSHWSDNAKPVG